MQNSLVFSFNPLNQSGPNDDKTAYTALLLRNRIKEIVGSYHHQFDHFYESVQNAVDACEKMFSLSKQATEHANYSPTVEIVVDLFANTLTVTDNGLGMSYEEVRDYYFTPNATLKAILNPGDEDVRQRGEKGVGAAFLAYGSNGIHLSTLSSKTNELTSGCLEGGRKWCFGISDILPMPEVVPCDAHGEITSSNHGTAVTIRFSDDTNIAKLADHGTDWKQWEAILRLYTAVGYVDMQGNDLFFKSLRANLTVINATGLRETAWMETGFFYPHLTTSANIQRNALVRLNGNKLSPNQRDMNIMWEKLTADQVSDAVTRRMNSVAYLRHKDRERLSSILSENKPEAYVALTYGSNFWEEANHQIWGHQTDGQFEGGIVFATKSQRIGVQKRIDFKFRSGDFNRFFILINMRNLRSDIGRKSFPEEISKFADFFANSIQKRFIDDNDCLKPSPGPFDEFVESELDDIKDKAYDRENLPLLGLCITKLPVEEQDVIALFFNLAGSQLIRGYEVFSTHISRKYDGVGRFELKTAPENLYDPTSNRLGIANGKFTNGVVKSEKKCFIEFKYTTDALVDDIRGGRKRLQDIKWLVCWEIGNKHVNEGIGVIDITEPAQVNQRDYYGVTHLMTENQDKVYIICLKKVLELLQ